MRCRVPTATANHGDARGPWCAKRLPGRACCFIVTCAHTPHASRARERHSVREPGPRGERRGLLYIIIEFDYLYFIDTHYLASLSSYLSSSFRLTCKAREAPTSRSGGGLRSQGTSLVQLLYKWPLAPGSMGSFAPPASLDTTGLPIEITIGVLLLLLLVFTLACYIARQANRRPAKVAPDSREYMQFDEQQSTGTEVIALRQQLALRFPWIACCAPPIPAATATAAAMPGTAPLEPQAIHFLGEWAQVRSENYEGFLSDNLGLSGIMLAFGARMPPPTVNFTTHDGILHCETIALGASKVMERLEVGEYRFHEPNMHVDYDVLGWWDGQMYVTERRALAINAGQPTVQKRWVDYTGGGDGVLIIEQSWPSSAEWEGGTNHRPYRVFTAHYERVAYEGR